MSAFGTSTPYYAPWGAVKTVGAAHTAFATWQGGAGDAYGNPCTPTTERWVASSQ